MRLGFAELALIYLLKMNTRGMTRKVQELTSWQEEAKLIVERKKAAAKNNAAFRSEFRKLGHKALQRLEAAPGSNFSEKQIDALIHMLAFKEDVFLVARCGDGKSLVFFSYMVQERGIGLIVVPMNLIGEQHAQTARKFGFGVLNLKTATIPDLKAAAAQVRASPESVIIIIGHPEDFLKAPILDELRALKDVVSLVSIDEVRLSIEWGLDFREAFYKLSRMLAIFQNKRKLILDASISSVTRAKIMRRLGITAMRELVFSIDPAHLLLFCHERAAISQNSRLAVVLGLVEKYPGEKGIVFFESCKAVDTFYKKLRTKFQELPRDDRPRIDVYYKDNIEGLPFFSKNELRDKFARWATGDIQILVATTASICCGADCKKVRWGFISSAPANMSDYLQIVGRIGRQMEHGEVHIDFSQSRYRLWKRRVLDAYSMDDSQETRDERNNILQETDHFAAYLHDAVQCRHQLIQKYSGFASTPDRCGNKCDNCIKGTAHLNQNEPLMQTISKSLLKGTRAFFASYTNPMTLVGDRIVSALLPDVKQFFYNKSDAVSAICAFVKHSTYLQYLAEIETKSTFVLSKGMLFEKKDWRLPWATILKECRNAGNARSVQRMRRADLIERLKEKSMPTTGSKAELVARFMDAAHDDVIAAEM